MNKEKIRTCEFVSPKHPDKICDFIADSILDAYLEKDANSRCGIEVMGGHGLITVSGEVTSKGKVDIEKIVKRIIGSKFEVRINLEKQSKLIAQGVDAGGAGDQGIMIGYATNETKNMMPLEYELSRNLCRKIYQKYPFDGKVQVTIENKKSKSVVASFQNTKSKDLEDLVRKHIKAEEYFINPAGEWTVGGFDADSGLSGRKIVIDSYGPNVPVGGGSFSGKDLTKIDRSGAYIARKIALEYLKKYNTEEVLVKLAYAIGKIEPVMAVAQMSEETKEVVEYNLTPQEIISALNIKKFSPLSQWGHFS